MAYSNKPSVSKTSQDMLLSSLLLLLLLSKTVLSQEYFDLYGSENYKATNDVQEERFHVNETEQIIKPSNTTARSISPTRSAVELVYHSSLATIVVLALLAIVALVIKSFLRRVKRRKFEREIAMSFLDTSLSSQFLKEQYKGVSPANQEPITSKHQINNIGGTRSPRQLFKFPSYSQDEIKMAGIPPIPSQIILITPGGDSRKSIWDQNDIDLSTLRDSHTSNISNHCLRKSSSTPSLPTRRGALLRSQEIKDELKALKKKRKKKRWKKTL